MTTLPLTEAKAKLNELVESAVVTHERVTITRHGKPAAVLLSVDDLAAIEETIFWLSVPGVHDDIAEAESVGAERWGEADIRRRFGVGTA